MAATDSAIEAAFSSAVKNRQLRRQSTAMTRLFERHKAALTFSLLFFGGIGLHYWPSAWPPDWGWAGEIRKPLADSLMVAGILGATVDTFLKAALMRDVGSIFIGWALPQEVRNYIRKVSQTALVRRNTTIDYHFTLDGDHVVVDTTIRSEVYNYGIATIPYQSQLALDRIENPDLDSIHLTLTKGEKAKGFDRNTLFKRKRFYKDEGHSHRWFAPKVRLQPQDANVANSPTCTTCWTMRRRMPSDYTTIEAVGTATLGLTVTLHAPPALEAFCKKTDDCVHADGTNVWQFTGLFMPDRHIRLYWRPRPH